MSSAVTESHNRLVGEIVKQMVKETIAAGGQMADVMVLLEGVIAGVLAANHRLGGAAPHLTMVKLLDGVAARLETMAQRGWSAS